MASVSSDNERTVRIAINRPGQSIRINKAIFNFCKRSLTLVRPYKRGTFLLKSSKGLTFGRKIRYESTKIRTKPEKRTEVANIFWGREVTDTLRFNGVRSNALLGDKNANIH